MEKAEKKFYLWLVSFYYRLTLVMLVAQILLVLFYFFAIQTNFVDVYTLTWHGMPFTGYL